MAFERVRNMGGVLEQLDRQKLLLIFLTRHQQITNALSFGIIVKMPSSLKIITVMD